MITQSAPRPMPSDASAARRAGLRAACSLLPALVPLGIALGAALAELSPPRLLSWLTGPLLTAGSSQLVLVDQLDVGAGAASAGLAAIAVNSRFVLYGAGLAGRFAGQPAWFRWIAPHFVNDQMYGLVLARLPQHHSDAVFRAFFTSSGTLLWCAWSASVGAGILFGPVLPPAVPLGFLLPAMFAALVVPGLQRRADLFAVVGGATLAGAGLGPTPILVFLAVGAILTVAVRPVSRS